MGFKGFIGAAAVCAALGTAAWAQDSSDNVVAAKTDWVVFTETNPKQCWGVSTPKETVNTKNGRVVAVDRGQILLMVFYQPDVSNKAQVAFTGGYPFKEGSRVSLNISGSLFELFAEGKWAWPESVEDEAKIIAAMKRGAKAEVTGLSGRGTTTKDSFSLLGFTASIEEAQKRCTG